MDAILLFVKNNPITVLVVLGALFAIAALTMGRRNYRGETNPEDILPSYKRYDRREIERGDRRKSRKGPVEGEDRRQGPRRSRD